MDGPDHLAAPHLEEHLPRLVDLEVIAGACRPRNACAGEPPPEPGVDPARAGQPVHLLEGEDRFERVRCVEAVDTTQGVVELRKPALEREHARASCAQSE